MITLVLLPGLDGTGLLPDAFARSFPSDVEVIIASYPRDQALGYPELEAIARTFLPDERPFYLLGESFSGPIAISIAASRPAGLLGVILCCSFVRSPRPLLGMLRPLLGVVPVAAVPLGLLSFFVLGHFSSPALRRQLAESLALVAPSALRARARAALTVDVSALLSRVEVPILYLLAAEDRVVPASAARLLEDIAPATRIVEIASPHFLLQARPAETAAKVDQFMRERTGCGRYAP